MNHDGGPKYIRGDAASRFWPKVDRTGDCWLWMRAVNTHGYGLFKSKEHGSSLAHRAAYEMLVGRIPDGHVLDHKCYTPACVRPEHLQVVTQALNMENRKGANRNSKTGVLGVSPTAGHAVRPYRAVFRGRQIGTFDTLDQAESAVIAARNSEYVNNLLDRTAS